MLFSTRFLKFHQHDPSLHPPLYLLPPHLKHSHLPLNKVQTFLDSQDRLAPLLLQQDRSNKFVDLRVFVVDWQGIKFFGYPAVFLLLRFELLTRAYELLEF